MISFSQLQKSNLERLHELEKGIPGTPFEEKKDDLLENWSILEWAGAMCGEAGEAANIAKKIRRGQNIDIDLFAEELADTVIYADLAAQKMGINLGEAIMKKFNEKSEKWKCKTVMTPLDCCIHFDN